MSRIGRRCGGSCTHSGLGNAFQEDWPDALFREGREEVRHAPPEVLPAERVEPRVGSEVLERLVAERGVRQPAW